MRQWATSFCVATQACSPSRNLSFFKQPQALPPCQRALKCAIFLRYLCQSAGPHCDQRNLPSSQTFVPASSETCGALFFPMMVPVCRECALPKPFLLPIHRASEPRTHTFLSVPVKARARVSSRLSHHVGEAGVVQQQGRGPRKLLQQRLVALPGARRASSSEHTAL